jgi:Ca2+-binding RTX toxin-like protein
VVQLINISAVQGTSGPDTIFDTSGDDNIDALGGDDTVTIRLGGTDTVDGNLGSDRLILDARSSVTFNLSSLTHTAGGLSGSATWAGASVTFQRIEHFTIFGSSAGASITTGSGNDTLRGGGGNDTLNGDAGDDIIEGGPGSDIMNGGTGEDTITYENETRGLTIDIGGNVSVDSSNESDTHLNFENVRGTAYDDELRGGDENNKLFGLAGNDRFIGRKGNDVFDGGQGNDTADFFFATSGVVIDLSVATAQATADGSKTFISIENLVGHRSAADTLTGNDANNILAGQGGDDVLNGAGGDDILDGGTGNDTMRGGTGNDVFLVGQLGDVVIEQAGEGVDEVRTSAGSRTDFTALYALAANVEKLTGTSFSPQGVRDNASDNIIMMGAGNDLIAADQGGEDVVDGGAGDDFLYFGSTWSGGDQAIGGTGYDSLGLMGGGTYTFQAGDLSSIEQLALYAGPAESGPFDYNVVTADAIVAAGERLFVNAFSLTAADTLIFDGGDELDGRFTILAGAGADTLIGGQKGDHLDGRSGNDTLHGRGGNDTLIGGLGADTLFGGVGRDIFTYNSVADSPVSRQAGSASRAERSVSSVDSIQDFEIGIDKISLRAIDADGDSTNGLTGFTYIGSGAFSGAKGELRYSDVGGGMFRVEADIDGDSLADFAIDVITTTQMPLVRSDFDI